MEIQIRIVTTQREKVPVLVEERTRGGWTPISAHLWIWLLGGGVVGMLMIGASDVWR
jgi:hypothetical protein